MVVLKDGCEFVVAEVVGDGVLDGNFDHRTFSIGFCGGIVFIEAPSWMVGFDAFSSFFNERIPYKTLFSMF